MERIFIEKTSDYAGKNVKVSGWVHSKRNHGKIIFIDLRDRTGIRQVIFSPQTGVAYKLVESLRSEWVVSIEGKINNRPKGMINTNIKTGSVEMSGEKMEILNSSETPPFLPDTDGYEIGEENRLKYRYIDLRRSRLQKNLEMRHKVNKFIRDYLTGKNFVEIETPILTKSTPEGARDYVVPSRLHSGKFYALPQSPQQYKQLLMVAGLERYFQIARCFRDEDTRGDRQPEFTQLDVEMSFITQEDILQLIEELWTKLLKEIYPEKHIQQTPWPKMSYKEVMEKYNSDKPDLRKNKNEPKELAFLWVVEFLAFEYRESEGRWDAVHHPFTALQTSDPKKIKKDPGKIMAYQYDLVLNGFEIGGGSIRIHRPELLQAVFELLGHTKEQIYAKFGHLLEAFSFGAPPHGGIACGLDRIMMILQNETSIREVIAFPKTGDGRDLMMDAPSDISPAQLKELGLSLKQNKT